VDAGEHCAVLTWGKTTGNAGAGLNWRFPIVQNFECFSTRGLVYEASSQPGESDADFTDFTVEAQTSDGQQIDVTYSVRFFVPAANVEQVYIEVAQNMQGVEERVIKFHSRSIVRLTMQEYSAGQLYTGDVFAVEQEISDRLASLFADSGIGLDSFVLRKIDFDPDFIQAIENQQIARENIETAQFQAQSAEFEADRIAVLARGQADAAIETARGAAEAQVIGAEAEAKAIRLRGEALDAYPVVLQLNLIDQLKEANWIMLPNDTILPFLQLPGAE
jgi:regulator of protease activity HflC (stomatin/prohibitin superfamily)